MAYTTACECGEVVEVTATQAGTRVECRCGREVQVPALSELRRQAGDEAYRRSTVETIRGMVREGELPGGEACAMSGLPTEGTIQLTIECERPWVRGRGASGPAGYAAYLLFGWVGLLFARRDAARRSTEYGRETSVSVPLRLRPEYHRRVRRFGQRRLKKLLRTVPIYGKLLEEYPGAVVAVDREG